MNMEQEIWKDIEGFEGIYQVSNWGNIRSMSRQVSRYEFRMGKLLKCKKSRNVIKVGLTNNSKNRERRDYRVDFLVAKAFIKGYTEGMIVIHVNNDQTDNRADNLKWIQLSDYTSYKEKDNKPLEIWKDIRGYEKQYQISNWGRVRSIPRIVNNIILKGEMIKSHINTNGYYQVTLKGEKHAIHRLVAIAFCNGYAKGLVVNHKDENKKNNRAENLEWVTSDYNKFYGTAMLRAKTKIRKQAKEKNELKEEKRKLKFTEHQHELSIVLDDEVWADITGFEGLYQISSYGRVKSLSRHHPNVQGGYYLTKEKILCPRKHTNGYLNVQLCKDGIKRNHYIHRLVANAFLRNDHPQEYIDVNHINEEKTDNRVSNLEWCSRVYNCMYGTKIERTKQNSPSMAIIQEKRNQQNLYGAEVPVLCVDNDGVVVAKYKSIMDASRLTGISASNICECCKGKRKMTGGYYWQYIDVERKGKS